MDSSPGGFTIVEPDIYMSSILSLTLTTLKGNPLFFFGLALTAAIPSSAFLFLDPFQLITKPQYMMMIGLGNVIIMLIGQGAVSYAVFESLKGEEIAAGASLWRGVSRLPTMCLIVILFVFIGIGFSALMSLTVVFLSRSGTVLVVIFLAVLVILGLALLCRMVVTIQVCVVEKAGALRSFNRSTELTAGNRLKLLALLIIVGFSDFAVKRVGSAIVGLVTQKANVLLFSNALFGIIMTAFLWVMLAILYFELRKATEGLSLANLADIFD